MTPLSVLPGAAESLAVDINDEGTILLRYIGGPNEGFFLLSADNVFTAIEGPAGGEVVGVAGLNNVGEVVGITASADLGSVSVWTPTPGGLDRDEIVFFDSPPVFDVTFNDTGLVAYADAGFISIGGNVFDRRTGTIDRFSAFGDLYIIADLLDSGGHVAAISEFTFDVQGSLSTGEIIRAFGCDDPAGTLCNFESKLVPNAINSSGVVVGFSEEVLYDSDGFAVGSNDIAEPFIWTIETGTIRLFDRVVTPILSPWDFTDAASFAGTPDVSNLEINDAGVIVGNGTLSGLPRAYALVPRPPCIADTNRDGRILPNDFSAWILAFNSPNAECD
ncbi:MAG: hypothetical protein AAFR76_15470 [Planctomycetota bacterium]